MPETNTDTQRSTSMVVADPLPPLAELPLPAELEADIVADESQDSSLIEQMMAEIDLSDSDSILMFGSKAQGKLAADSDSILTNVRTKDLGPAGDALNTMVSKLKLLDSGSLTPGKKPSFIARLLGLKSPIDKFMGRYQEVRGQIDEITDKLDSHQTNLMRDVEKLDILYDSSLDYFHELELYIRAGEARLKQLDESEIPSFAKEVEASNNVLDAQKLRDMRARRDDLERRVHDLKLTRQVTMQSLPSIRLIQENDKALISKIKSVTVNTVPLWRTQLAQALTLSNARDAAESVRAANDLTNDLLESNAANLKETNRIVREEYERGIFDAERVKKANDLLIETIEDSLRIADEGKAKRREAESLLQQAEADLKATLASAKARADQPAPSGAS